MVQNLDSFIAKWPAVGPAERANKDLFLAELCAVLGVPEPNPSTTDPERETYVFERKVKLADVAAAFRGAKKDDVEEVLDSLAAYETYTTRRWKPTRHE